MSLTQPPKDRAMHPEAVRTKIMSNENENKDLPAGRTMVKILKPFKYNGEFVQTGDAVEMNEERAVNHMRVGDVERNEGLINKIKQGRIDAAEAAKADAGGDW